jgi:hypothetical protein
MEAILDFPSAMKKRNLVEDHPIIIPHADGKSKIAVTAQLSLN